MPMARVRARARARARAMLIRRLEHRRRHSCERGSDEKVAAAVLDSELKTKRSTREAAADPEPEVGAPPAGHEVLPLRLRVQDGQVPLVVAAAPSLPWGISAHDRRAVPLWGGSITATLGLEAEAGVEWDPQPGPGLGLGLGLHVQERLEAVGAGLRAQRMGCWTWCHLYLCTARRLSLLPVPV